MQNMYSFKTCTASYDHSAIRPAPIAIPFEIYEQTFFIVFEIP